MAIPPEIAELRVLCPGAAIRVEGGSTFVDLPQLKIPTTNGTQVRDALLSLQGHSGYDSRLLLSEPIKAPKAVNWTVHSVFGRTWHTPSWNKVFPTRPVEMLLQHLKAYQ